MPQNMQHRPKVAELEIEELETEEEKILSDDEYYDKALKYLQRGMKQKDVENYLVSAGLSRLEARKLAEKVWSENPETQRTNAYILLGTAAVIGILGILLLILNILDWGVLPLVSPSYILILVSAWFVYKGLQAYRKVE